MKFKADKRKIKKIAGLAILFIVVVLSIPLVFQYFLKFEDNYLPIETNNFPATVDFRNQTISEDATVEAYLNSEDSPFQASVIFVGENLKKLFSYLAISISRIGESSNLALVGGEKFITINPGLRKEEVANMFGRALSWTEEEKREFLTPQKGSTLPLSEGSYYPGVYSVSINSAPQEVQNIINNRFNNNVISRYGTTTAEKVPLEVALTVASLIQRETIGTDDMRLVSGIIWNRIFKEMHLQLDATLQYAKASSHKTSVWWPQVLPRDKYIKSPYNTYMHKGLPPTPIANPSIAAVLAALNPIKTDCLFYFHDKKGNIHCTATYKEHVTLLKQLYGQGS